MQFTQVSSSKKILFSLDLLEISIFDIRGKRLSVSSQDQRYDVSHLDNGVYFIEVLDKLNMKSSIIKLIKTE